MSRVWTVVLLALILCGGCASGKVGERDVLAGVPGAVEMRVGEANGLFDAGEFAEAERAYQALLAEYGAEAGEFRVAVLTNICLCRLEMGDRNRFKDCAGKLREASREQEYLARETQMVLELDSIVGSKGAEKRDVRIEARIAEGLEQVLGKEGK